MPKVPSKAKPLKPDASVLTFTNPDGPDAFTPMNFKVPSQFHREFKLYAVQNGVSMVDLLQQCFYLMKSQRKR